MDPLDAKIDEALGLEAAREQAARDAETAEAARLEHLHQRQEIYRRDVLVPALEDLDARLRAREAPHHVVGRERVIKIRSGTGDGGPGVDRLTLLIVLGEDPAERGWAHVSASRGTDAGGWEPLPALSGQTHRFNPEGVAGAIMDEWIRAATAARA